MHVNNSLLADVIFESLKLCKNHNRKILLKSKKLKRTESSVEGHAIELFISFDTIYNPSVICDSKKKVT